MRDRSSEDGEYRVSAEIPDWKREQARRFWDPAPKLLLAIRRYQYWRSRGGALAVLACKCLVLRHRFWSVVAGADIPLNSHIGGGLVMLHPNGIVIHPDARVGVNCLIFHQVTIGMRNGPGLPELGGHVEVGAGAKILGPIHIGDHAKIGANAVVVSDVPSNAVAIGVPARVQTAGTDAKRDSVQSGPAAVVIDT
jgi:serine O-acetyltransferase